MGGRWRGVAVVALGAAVAVPSLLVQSPAQAQADDPAFLPGFGQAVGQLVRVDPQAAGLSFGLEIGAAKASHQQFTSRSSSRVFNAGLLGLSLASDACTGKPPTWPMEKQPQAITIDSRTEGAAEGETLVEVPFERFVAAAPSPSSEAYVTAQSLGIPGIAEIGLARSEARSGTPEPGLREARATVDIAEVSLLGGVVVLRGLHWEAVHRGGLVDEHTGTFTLGALEIAGAPIELPDVGVLFDTVNDLLAPLGIRLGEPVAHLSGKVQFIDPLSILIEPNPQRDALSGGLLRALHPLREALFDRLLALTCDAAALITVADLLIGSVTGAGTFSVELGGAEATTEPIAVPAPRATPTTAPAPTSTPPSITGRPATNGTAPVTPVATTPPLPSPPGTEAAAAIGEPIAAPVEEPGRDLAAVVGLVTMALGAVLVEGDRRSMRRAAREAAE